MQNSEEETSKEQVSEQENTKSEDEMLANLTSEVQQNHEKYLRAVADLENFKKRALKERAELIKYAGENLARDLVEVIDDLERALAAEYPGANQELVKGIELVLGRFQSVFEKHSIKGESALNQEFNPEKHEALSTVSSPEHNAGEIIEEFKKAYFIKDKLLRPASVVVACEDKD